MSIVTRTVQRMERMRNSAHGNPRYRVHFTDGTVVPTTRDADVGHGAENSEYLGVPLRVTLNNKTGEIDSWEIAKSDHP